MMYVCIFLISVFISSISQILLKLSAKRKYDNYLKEYLNLKVVGAYGMFFISTLLTMYAYKGVALSFGVLLESVGYIYVPILSYFCLNEKMTKMKVIGSIFIVLGIFCYTLL